MHGNLISRNIHTENTETQITQKTRREKITLSFSLTVFNKHKFLSCKPAENPSTQFTLAIEFISML